MTFFKMSEREKICKARNLYSREIPFRTEGEMKTFSRKKNTGRINCRQTCAIRYIRGSSSHRSIILHGILTLHKEMSNNEDKHKIYFIIFNHTNILVRFKNKLLFLHLKPHLT